jgi:hypothetical protein
VEVDSGNSAYVNIINNLTLDTNTSVPAGVTLVVKDGKTLKVNGEKTLDLTAGGLILENDTTLTVDGTVNARGASGPTSFGIGLMPGQMNTTINGTGTIHLKTPGVLLGIMADQKLTLSGSITLDGLRTAADGGTDSDTINNVGQVVFVSGELDMQGGTITGNYNTASYDGGGVEVNGELGGKATFTMSGNAEVSGNRTVHGGAGVRVNQGSGNSDTTFTMSDNAEISGNTAGTYGGGVWVRDGGSFILNGGTVTGSSASSPNTASSGGASLYVRPGDSGTAKWGGASTNITGGTGGASQGGDILSGTGGTDDTLSAVSP